MPHTRIGISSPVWANFGRSLYRIKETDFDGCNKHILKLINGMLTAVYYNAINWSFSCNYKSSKIKNTVALSVI